MKTLRNAIIILILFGVVFGYFGMKAYQSRYVAPRKKLADQLNQLQQQISDGTDQLQTMERVPSANMKLFTRSFPLNPSSARTEYQLWLTQMAEFCEMTEPQVRVGAYQRGAGIASHKFQLRAECTLEQLYRFLYEFYWTSYLHRVDSMDVQAIEGSESLDVALAIEGLTMAKVNARNPYPLANQLPLSWSYEKRLASGPFAAYGDYTKLNPFRYAKPGIDDANFTILTGLPTVIDAAGASTTQTRWKIESQGRTVTLGLGGRLTVGSFDGQIESIQGEMVILRHASNGFWIVPLGEKLSNAVAIPALW